MTDLPEWLIDFINAYDSEAESVMGHHNGDPERTFVLMSVADWRQLSEHLAPTEYWLTDEGHAYLEGK